MSSPNKFGEMSFFQRINCTLLFLNSKYPAMSLMGTVPNFAIAPWRKQQQAEGGKRDSQNECKDL
jgi:hypothetical protein